MVKEVHGACSSGASKDLELVIAVDNSGSMARIRSYVLEALVVVMQVLRRLEYRFAVAAVGDAKNCRVLKNFEDPFDAGFGD